MIIIDNVTYIEYDDEHEQYVVTLKTGHMINISNDCMITIARVENPDNVNIMNVEVK